MTGVALENLTWDAAQAVLTPQAIVVIPLGAATKEHGYHLQLNNDFLLAEFLKERVLEQCDVVVAPTINYSFYPAFIEYPGSVCLSQETATKMIQEICQSLARFGPRKFYILNTGVSTIRCLKAAASNLAQEGIVMHYTDLDKAFGETVEAISQQEGGSHADEIETSMMLHIAPHTVNMSKATAAYYPNSVGRLTRDEALRNECSYSESGVWGDATLATHEKGVRVVQSLLDSIFKEIDALKRCDLPTLHGSGK